MEATSEEKVINCFLSRYPNRREQLYKIQYSFNNYLNEENKNQKEQPESNIDALEQMNSELLLFQNFQQISSENYIQYFKDLPSLKNILYQNLNYFNFIEMTPIQRLSIPNIFNHYDLVGCAQTGSGKTIAYLIPILNKLLSEPPKKPDNKNYFSFPLALIILPTRELALQTYKESIKICKGTNIVPVVIFGGVPGNYQFEDVKRGCDILISTPGRLIDFLQKGMISLSQIQFVVIDEADNLLDMGFEPDIDHVIFEFDMPDVEDRQTLLFSATFPKQVKGLFHKYLNDDFIFITNKDNIKYDGQAVNANIVQRFYFLEDDSFMSKVKTLHRLLQIIKAKTLIFVNTKLDVDTLHARLGNMDYNVHKIHGDLGQEKRNVAMRDFSTGEVPLLIATDVASRGLDIPNVDFVINFDMPNNIEKYIHRIGRTGRAGRKGNSITLLTYQDINMFKSLVHLLEKTGQKIPDFLYGHY